jgi:hypothetical protein
VKLSRFLAPRSENPDKKKLIVKKVLSSLLATLVMSFAMLDTALDLPADDAEPVTVRFGLNRQRPAFRKAVSMLKEAAPANQRLADYYGRVTRRVNDDGAECEKNEGGVLAVAVRRNNSLQPRVTNVAPATASMAPSQASESLIAVVQAAISENSPPANYQTDGDSESPAENGPSEPAELTVGDVAFDTNEAIERWIDYYSTNPIGRSTLQIGIERSNAYLEMARAEFRSAGVPEDLVWLAFVESVWNPRAVSPAAAGGLWQFIPSTATEYGLRVENGNDERSDPFKQTRVAAAYLHDLFTIFGDWPLALAAYNSGEPRVMGAIVRNGNANFWELSAKGLLPKETCEYVPKILATIKLTSSAEDYGLIPYLETTVSAGD